MRMKRLFLLASALIVGFTAMAKEQPKWLQDAVIYHIYPNPMERAKIRMVSASSFFP